VEGLQIIGMALENGATPLEVFASPPQFHGDTAPKLLATMDQAGARITEVAPNVMSRLSDREEPQGLVVAFALLQSDIAEIIKAANPSLVFVLDRLQDPGNLGTLIRTADAVGAAGIVLIEPCVDRFDPKTVGASMGSLFSLPIVASDDAGPVFSALADWTIVAADAHEGELAWQGSSLDGSVALVLGNEAHGLTAELRPRIAEWVRLPILGKAESLNVAVAGGTLSYEWLRRNHPAP
jgi:TrmH family RNA methyltransferase